MSVEGSGNAPGTGTANVPAATATPEAAAGVIASGAEGQAAADAGAQAGAGGGDTATTADAAGGAGEGGSADGSSSADGADAGDPEGEAGAEGEGGEQPPALSVPDGMAITPEWQEKLDTYATSRGLDHSAKQEVVDMGVALHQQLLESITDAHKERVAAWEQEARQEHGQKFDAVVSAAQGAFARFGSPALKELMVQYGIGNHPAMLNAFAAVADVVREPGNIAGTGTAQSGAAVDDNSEEARAARMYSAATKRSGRDPSRS